ncbi:alkB, alkylation repair 4 [Tyrophagus putrescentiae]|nr:alkB, alkylation repair 4 [Tyrophagus putrescentiae]
MPSKDCACKEFEAHFLNHETSNSAIKDDEGTVLSIDGVYLQEEVLTKEEESHLISSIDSFGWNDSQSGRRKQDFGPKINFKKKKINFTSFYGLPQLDMKLLERIKKERLRDDANCTKFSTISSDVLEKDTSASVLCNFKTVEVCHLEYCPERGSSIDPHFDDFWIWGERLVTLNLLSSTVITLTIAEAERKLAQLNYCIRISLPPRSLLVLYGDARHRYEHSIRRADITDRRLAITYRELPATFLDPTSDDYQRIGKEFISRAEVLLIEPQRPQ